MDLSVGHQISTRKAAGRSPYRYMQHSVQNCEPGRPRRTSYGTSDPIGGRLLRQLAEAAALRAMIVEASEARRIGNDPNQ